MLSAVRLPQVRAEACISLQASWERSKVWTVRTIFGEIKVQLRIIVRRSVRSMFGRTNIRPVKNRLYTVIVWKEKACHTQGHGHREGLCSQNMTVYWTVKQRRRSFCNQSLSDSRSWKLKPECLVKILDRCVQSRSQTAKVQNIIDCLSVLYLLSNCLLDNQTRWVDVRQPAAKPGESIYVN